MDIWRLVIFAVFGTTLWTAIHAYIGIRLIKDTKLKTPYNRYAWGVVAIHGMIGPTVMFLRGYSPTGEWYQAITYVSYVGMGFVFSLVLILLFKDLFVYLVKFVSRFSKTEEPVDEGRRTILTTSFNLGAFAITGATTTIGHQQARKIPDVVEVEVPISGLPKSLDGFTIAQLSDVHIGPTLKAKFLEGVVDKTMKLDADAIVITGDLIDGYVDQLHPELKALDKLQADHGVFFVTGNHEYYWDGPAWTKYLATRGIKVLSNEHELIRTKSGGRLLMGGVTDYRASRHSSEYASDPHKAMKGAPAHDFSVLLAHQPTSVYEAEKAGWGMQLSGHTHGGQFFPWNLFVGLYHEFSRGLDKHNDTWIYVSSGTGYWGPPNRFAVASEITRITLRAA